jgi:hypothetical protein
MMKHLTISLLTLTLATLSGCGTTTTERAGSGALLGGATGAAIGSMSGDTGKGALIGAGVGAVGGLLYDQSQKTNENNRYYDDRYYNNPNYNTRNYNNRSYNTRYQQDRDYYDLSH